MFWLRWCNILRRDNGGGNLVKSIGECGSCGPFAVFDAKAGVLEGQVVVFGVFLPQQLQGDTGALEFSVHVGKVRKQLFAVTR